MKLISKITVIAAIVTLVGIAFLLAFYLFGLNYLVKSDFLQKKLGAIVKDNFKLELQIANPELKTYLKGQIDFSVEHLALTKEGEQIVLLENFNLSLNFSKILQKNLKLNRLTASALILNTDKLLEIMEENPSDNSGNFDWYFDFYEAQLQLDDFEATYRQKNNTTLDLYLRDIAIEDDGTAKTLSFNSDINIKRGDKTYVEIVSSTLDEIKVLKDGIKIDNLRVMVNDSRLRLDASIDSKNAILKATSDLFYLKDVFNIINSNFIIPDGASLLAPLKNPSGNVDFIVNSTNGALEGFINIKNTKASLKDVSYIPLSISKGRINIYKDRVDFINLKGFYGKNRKNEIDIKGSIKDYYKTFDSNITIDTLITNEFFKDYLAPLISNTVLYVSNPAPTRIIYKAKNNIMDIVWLARLDKGVKFGTIDSKTELSAYQRFIKGDFHIEGNKFDIKNINYYMSEDAPKRGERGKREQKPVPIFVLNGKMLLVGTLQEAGFSFSRETPSEVLNIFLGQEFFKKGTIKGWANIVFRHNIPKLEADMEIYKTLIPSQRLFIKEAILKTNKDDILISSKGGFKRTRYDFDAKIKNELQTPITVQKLRLDIDNLDVEKFLTSSASSENEAPQNQAQLTEEGIADDNYMFDTNLLRIVDAEFNLKEGKYKELTFGNVKANMSLDDKGLLKISSNRFDIAQGHSSLKVECDLKNLKYYIRLGAKDVNSDLMARVLFNLDKEITGLASGVMELYTDKTLKLNGNIKFIIKNGTIGKIGLVEYVLKIASLFRNPIVMINPAIIMDIISVPEGKFDKITGEVQMKNNVLGHINIKSYSNSLSALIRGRFDLERHDASLRIYTRFSSDKNTMFGFLRNISLNALANKIQMKTRNDANYYSSELSELPQIEVEENKTQVFLTQIEGDVENNNFLSSLKKIK